MLSLSTVLKPAKYLGFSVIFILFLRLGLAINAPEIHCLAVLPNGNVQLTWTAPPDPLGEFKEYELFSATALGGPYSSIAILNSLATTSFTHAGANAQNTPRFYYMRINTLAGGVSGPADTLRTIFLVMNSVANSSVVKVQWNHIATPPPVSSAAFFYIWREHPVGNWSFLDSVPATSGAQNFYFNDTIRICNDSINYRIELKDVSGCVSVSNVKGNWFQDKNSPNPAQLDSVSVNNLGQAVIGISPSSSPDVKCYVIYIYKNNTYNAIDTICNGNLPAFYTYTLSLAGTTIEQYSIAALDSCGNISPIALNTQNTMLVSANYNQCARTISLNWNAYKNIKGGLNGYEVLQSLNGGPYVQIGTSPITSYTVTNVLNNTNYCFKIRARANGFSGLGPDSVSSLSARICVTTASTASASYVFLKRVSYLPSQSIVVEWSFDNTAPVGGFEIYRSKRKSGPYSLIKTQLNSGANPAQLIDNAIIPGEGNYYYYIHLLDSCMNPGVISDTSKTILLSVKPNDDRTNFLSWDDYAYWPTGTISFDIYRSIDGVFDPVPITTIPFGTNFYLDDVSPLVPHTGKFDYYVVANENSGNPYGFTSSSMSNTVRVYHEAEVFIPNAFFPKGKNKIFLPVTQFTEKTDYILRIFNRWGNQIYQTVDENEGWDGGNYEGGVYAYLLQFKTSFGEIKEYKGTVMLIR